jgi:zinc transport system substrate-binding protein
MKKILYLLLIVLIGCAGPKKEKHNKVTVTILPQKYFVDQIAGNLLEVNVLVPPGTSYHNYEVLPSQMKDLAKSRMWIQIGMLTFEEVWKEKLAQINPELVIVDCSEQIATIAGSECAEEGHSHNHDHAVDPHIWMAPNEVKAMSLSMLNALKSAFPEHAKVFESNYAAFVSRIDSLSVQINQKLMPVKSRNILIFHPALAYFAREFNLTQIAMELDGKEPSPRHMKAIVDLAREQNIKIIFIQKEFDSENALQLSREIGGEVVVIDPLDYNWEKQLMDIADKISRQP